MGVLVVQGGEKWSWKKQPKREEVGREAKSVFIPIKPEDVPLPLPIEGATDEIRSVPLHTHDKLLELDPEFTDANPRFFDFKSKLCKLGFDKYVSNKITGKVPYWN